MTHAFALEDLRDAVATAIDKRDAARDQGRVRAGPITRQAGGASTWTETGVGLGKVRFVENSRVA